MWTTWPNSPPTWTLEDCEEVMKTNCKEDIPKVTVQQIMDSSEKFPIEFPIDSTRCKTLIKDTPEEDLSSNINSVYPVLHEYTLNLYAQFLRHKRIFGSAVEKKLYGNLTLDGLVTRLLTKRAVVFVGPRDMYLLMDDIRRMGGWEQIGSPEEKAPLLLKDCLSYDEIKLSALLSVSSATQFINVGDRNNCGVVEKDLNKIEQNGIIIGLVGARLKKPGVMEHQELVVSQKLNTQAKEDLPPTTKDLFLNFYGESAPPYDLNDKSKFSPMRNDNYFNNILYEKRLALSIDTLLIEANARAKAKDTMAYIHVVGIGLGVWKLSPVQDELFMNTFAKRIEFLSSTLDRIADICFSYMRHPSCGKYKNGDIFPLEGHGDNGIRIHISDRNPHEKLEKPSEGNLLVVSYAWDGNALPGNEFWLGELFSSGDPAAASSTQIAELHNPHINPRVCGANLRVATLNGLLTFKEYQDSIRRQYKESLPEST